MRPRRRPRVSIALTVLLVSAGAIAPASIRANDPPVQVGPDAGEDVTSYPALDNVPPADETPATTDPGPGGKEGPAAFAPTGRASASASGAIVVEDGETQPVFS